MDLPQNFQLFWSDLCKFIENSFKYSVKNGILSNVLSQGIISILSEGKKPREFLKKKKTNFAFKCYIETIIYSISQSPRTTDEYTNS